MACRRALAHPVPARQTDLAIQLHGVNPPALPTTGKLARRVGLRAGPGPRCISFGAVRVDAAVGAALMRALEPVGR